MFANKYTYLQSGRKLLFFGYSLSYRPYMMIFQALTVLWVSKNTAEIEENL